jgi:MFS family permease
MPNLAPNGRKAWIIAWLLFLYSVVNFIDKLVMGLAAVPIMQEFGLKPAEYGALASSFFFLYAIAGLVVGLFVVRRVSTKTLLLLLVGIWTLSQLPMAFGSSLLALYAGRILLGLGEGPGTPSAYHALYGWFTSEQRNMPTSLLLAGVGVGFLIGSPVLTSLIASFGWRAGFLFCGAVGLFWMLLWALFGQDGPLIAQTGHRLHVERSVPWRRFWSDPTVIANFVMALSCYWVTGLSITWLAPYLQLGLGYTPRDTGWLVSVILGSGVAVQMSLSYVSHRLLSAGISSRLSRGALTGGAVMLAGVAMAAAPGIQSTTLQVLMLAAGFTLPSLTFVIGPTIVGEVAPAQQRGTALLVTYSLMTVTGLLAPIVTGWVVQAAGATPLVGYSNALMLTGAILVLGGLWSVLGINPEATRARFADQATGDHPLAATSD